METKTHPLNEKSFAFSCDSIDFVASLEMSMTIKILSGQYIRSATSIGANIAEAKGSSSRREFTNYYHNALKSARETIYWLRLFRKAAPLKSEKIDILEKECTELIKMLLSAILTLKGKK